MSTEAKISSLEAQVARLQREVEELRAMTILLLTEGSVGARSSASTATSTDSVPTEHKVIIAAAVAALLGSQAKVRTVHHIHSTGQPEWARRGRELVFGSHRTSR